MILVKVSIIIMQPITIQFAVRARKDYTPLDVYLGCVWVVIYVKYITYEGQLHNTLALDVDRQTEHLLRSISHLQLQCHSIAIQRRPVLRPERSLPHRPPTIIIIIIDIFINL